MATIVPLTQVNGVTLRFPPGRAQVIRSVTAQATVGQTDWILVPQWATYALVVCNVSASGGTTPICLLELLGADPVVGTDTNVWFIGGATTTTGVTSTGVMVASIGPGVTGIANDVAFATSGASNVYLNDLLPGLLGVKILNDRTTGDENYTYTVSVDFRE